MALYDVDELKNYITNDDIFDLLKEWGGEPKKTSFGILSATICHNEPGEGSHKLYFYNNSNLFRCYTGCNDYFDIFELVRKVASIQWHQEYSFYDAVSWIARRLGFSSTATISSSNLDDWQVLKRYADIEEYEEIEMAPNIELPLFDDTILKSFNYKVKIEPWLREGISDEVMRQARIGYYPVNNQITIPHFDKDNRFIGLRGRTLSKEDAELYGKYRPMKINRKMYNHPLGFNLYNLNFSKNNIAKYKKAIVFEGEKSTLLYKTYFGLDNDISVACCGSSLSAYQMKLLLDLGVEEVVVAFDRQFQELGDTECRHLTSNFKKLHMKYHNQINMSFIFDKELLTEYKDSPIDKGKDIFITLFKGRVKL